MKPKPSAPSQNDREDWEKKKEIIGNALKLVNCNNPQNPPTPNQILTALWDVLYKTEEYEISKTNLSFEKRNLNERKPILITTKEWKEILSYIRKIEKENIENAWRKLPASLTNKTCHPKEIIRITSKIYSQTLKELIPSYSAQYNSSIKKYEKALLETHNNWIKKYDEARATAYNQAVQEVREWLRNEMKWEENSRLVREFDKKFGKVM